MSGNRRGQGRRPLPPGSVITTAEHLEQVVDYILDRCDAFAFDVETRATLSGHEYLRPFIEADVAAELRKLVRQDDVAQERVRAAVEKKYIEMLQLDPMRNEVFWIGLAVDGHSWAIPMGHPRGNLLRAEEVGDGTTVPPPGYRKILASGKESEAKAKYVIPAVYAPKPRQLDKSTVFDILRRLFWSKLRKVGHNVKFDARSIAKYFDGEVPPGPYDDTMVLLHLLDENLLRYDLASTTYFCYRMKPWEEEGKLGALVKDVAFDKAARYVQRDVRWTWMNRTKLLRLLRRDDHKLLDVYERNMEDLRVLMKMEQAGVAIDVTKINELKDALDGAAVRLQRDMAKYVWRGFNPDSNPDKVKLLFNKKADGGLGLKVVKTTKGGNPSVDKDVMAALEGKHPMVDLLVQWQDVQKLRSTYVEGLRHRLYKGRIHANFKITGTVTGRLSCTEPNLQNIPRAGDDEDDIGQKIRSLFIARPGYKLVVFDYGQVELRVLAMLSKDPALVKIFQNHQDVHSGTIAQIRRIPIEKVTKEERQLGKTLAFAITYGAGPDKVAVTAKVAVRVAEETIEGYWDTFKGVTKWKVEALRGGRTNGFVRTISGRKRRLPDLNHQNYGIKGRAERQAINAIIQGSAADICLDAMIAVDQAFEGTPCRLLLQVHDELMAEVPDEWVEKALRIMPDAMGHGTLMRGVPLEASGKAAESWAKAK